MSINNTNVRRMRGGGRSTSGRPTTHERSAGTTFPRIEYPPAPRMLTVPLSAVHDTPTVTTVRSGSIEPLPNDLLIREGRILSVGLQHREIPRAVVSPVVSDMPGYTGHMWGAAKEYVDGSMDGRRVHFVDSMAAATNPPQTRLKIMTPRGETLIVYPRAGNRHVAVGDVQRAVIGWMRRVEMVWAQSQSTELTQRMIVWAKDGTRMEVETWAWRGLLQVRGRVDLWAIRL